MLDCKQLSKQSKLDLINIYENSEHRSKIQHLINYLKMTMEYEGNIYECADFLERLDVLRKTNWQKTFTELFKSINS
jgi:hypothetical protein